MTDNSIFGTEGFVSRHPHPAGLGGVQHIYHYSNGYGASIVQSPFSYGGDEGLWEVAVLKKEGDGWPLTYDTPITGDVLGYLSQEGVVATLKAISELQKEKAQ